MYIIPNYDVDRISDAKEVQKELLERGYELSLAETIDFWYYFSDRWAASWLVTNDIEIIERSIDYIMDWSQEKRICTIKYD